MSPLLATLHLRLSGLARRHYPNALLVTKLSPDALLVSRAGNHAVGIWSIEMDQLTFTQFGNNVPSHRVGSVTQAVEITLAFFKPDRSAPTN